MSFETLRDAYPWPDERPNLPKHIEGWVLHVDAWRDVFGGIDAPVVLEVGAYLGKTSLHILETYPESKLIAIDLWQPGDTELSQRKGREFASAGLAQADGDWLALYMANLWDFRERVVCVQCDSLDGMCYVREHLQPDVVYIDAAHDYQSVLEDIHEAKLCFPDALICGDDYEDGPSGVKRAVHEVAEREGYGVKTGPGSGRFWRYER